MNKTEWVSVDTVTTNHIPEFAKSAIEYCVWTCCQDIELRSGPTPLYWALMSVLAKHIQQPPNDKEKVNA